MADIWKIYKDPKKLETEKEKKEQKYKKLGDTGKKNFCQDCLFAKNTSSKNWRKYSDNYYKIKTTAKTTCQLEQVLHVSPMMNL